MASSPQFQDYCWYVVKNFGVQWMLPWIDVPMSIVKVYLAKALCPVQCTSQGSDANNCLEAPALASHKVSVHEKFPIKVMKVVFLTQARVWGRGGICSFAARKCLNCLYAECQVECHVFIFPIFMISLKVKTSCSLGKFVSAKHPHRACHAS